MMRKATTSVLLWEPQAAALTSAAAKRGMNVSEYVRDVLVPLACQDAGIPVPKVPELQRQAAKSGPHAVDAALIAAVVRELRKQAG